MTKILDEKNELAATPESNDPVEGLAQSYLEKSPSDVFSDLSQLRFPQNFEPVGVTPVLMAVPVRKTNKTKFARLHPDDWVEAFTLETDDQEIYFVLPKCGAQLGDDLKVVTLFRAVTRQGVELLWPVALPPEGRAPMAWHTSARSG